MKFEDYPLGYPSYMLFRNEDGFYLSTSMGQVATLEEAKYFAEEIVRYAKEHEKDIEIHNLKSELEFMRSHYGEPKLNPKKRLPKKRYVYLLKCGDKFKVGVSKNVDRRIKELDKRPLPVNLVTKSKLVHCAFEAEKEIHEWLDEYRIDGEWFNIPDSLMGSVIQAIKDIDDLTYGYEGN